MQLNYSIEDTIGIITPADTPDNSLHPDTTDKCMELADFLATPHLKAAVIFVRSNHFSRSWFTDKFCDESKSLSFKRVTEVISFAPVPVAAVITDTCEGPDLLLALAAHFRFASDNTVFKLGTTVKDVRFSRLLKKMLNSLLSENRIAGDLTDISAEEAHRKGLIDWSGETQALENEAQKFLSRLTGKRSPQLIHTIMQSIHKASRMDIREALFEESRLFNIILRNRKEIYCKV